jgi:transposase
VSSPALGYGRGGFSTKIHLVTDGQGVPLGAVLSAGQRHESAFFEATMDTVRVPQPVGRPRKRPEAVAGDRAYDAFWIRRWCHQHNIESVILSRKGKTGPGRPPTCDEQKYENRNVVERCVGRLKERRRIATRYEKKASHYKAMVQWAFIGEYLKR